MAYAFIISKTLDPIFAISIGVGAAAARINRDEKAKGRSTAEIFGLFKRRVGLLFAEKEQVKK
ncbi:hypothetical protein K432DRAFT_400398 [Lepidopterella palustris CBS 459.81]|uniref:Uncharacterized protein n=1 Tax=Lepidopterella palustris CBS 459.81 TaxID=1314670 RepID=A0A8E2JKF6_9PEZI|nr:hypothetical protein K432DRAFT_400398 [Lepidopterella palustris CBS 459.81]